MLTAARAPDACPALVLNADYRPLSYFPLSLWSWQDAVKRHRRRFILHPQLLGGNRQIQDQERGPTRGRRRWTLCTARRCAWTAASSTRSAFAWVRWPCVRQGGQGRDGRRVPGGRGRIQRQPWRIGKAGEIA